MKWVGKIKMACLNLYHYAVGYTPYPSETSKVRHKVIKYCEGYGCDIGFGGDKIKKENCVGIDMARPYAKTGDESVDIACWVGKEPIPVLDNTFDYVYSSHLIEDFGDTAAILKEFVRVLKHRGNLILVFPDQHKYEQHCKQTGQSLNKSHVHADMDLWFILDVLVKNRIARMDQLLYYCEPVNKGDYNVIVVLKILKQIL